MKWDELGGERHDSTTTTASDGREMEKVGMVPLTFISKSSDESGRSGFGSSGSENLAGSAQAAGIDPSFPQS
jgi:hypothetical protein